MTKKFERKKQKKRKFFAERQRSALGKEVPLPSAKVGTRQRATFAERLTEGAGQRPTVGARYVLRWLFAECYPLPSVWRLAKTFFAECFSLPRSWRLVKESLPSAFFAESPALGKGGLCRAPDK
jgi:hypothetical protein